jgi:NAD(P)-dependent dehydrogenase (short-subunit alcohol dehydrogenase family)
MIDTPMLAGDAVYETANLEPATPISRLGRPEEVADIICFLLSDDSSFVTGSTYTVDGGWHC